MKEAALWNSANQGDKGVISSIQGDLIEYFPDHLHGGKNNQHQTHSFLAPENYLHPQKLLSSRNKDDPGVLFASKTQHITKASVKPITSPRHQGLISI